MTRVLVTGAAGMLGHALRGACPEGVEFIGVDVDELDITDAAAVEAAMGEHRPDVVLNAAAYTNVDGCEEHEDDALAVNGHGATHLARAAAAIGAPLLHVSTDYVFDGTIEAPGQYLEGDAVNPLSAYGRTKLAGERGVVAGNDAHWIVRTQWLYGLDGKNFVDTMLWLADNKPHLEVVDDQVGSPTSTHDLADALWAFVLERPAYGVYHVRNEGEASWYDFAAEIFERAGRTVDLRRTDSQTFVRPAPRPARSVLSTEKLRAALGRGLPPWQDGLADYLARKAAQTSTEHQA